MELRGVRLIGNLDEIRVSSGRIMAAYLDRRRQAETDALTQPRRRPRRRTPEAVRALNPESRWVVSGFFLIASTEVKRWSGSTDLFFEAGGIEFHVVSLSKWTSSPTGFETWNFRALCAPTEAQLKRLPTTVKRRTEPVEAHDSSLTEPMDARDSSLGKT
jgi:hypothetical protein